MTFLVKHIIYTTFAALQLISLFGQSRALEEIMGVSLVNKARKDNFNRLLAGTKEHQSTGGKGCSRVLREGKSKALMVTQLVSFLNKSPQFK